MGEHTPLWLESVHSDGTAAFVSNPSPKLFETVTVKLRFYRDAPVKHVFLRTIPNGVERLIPMTRGKEEKGLVYYEAPLEMTENRMQYQFYLVCEDVSGERSSLVALEDSGLDIARVARNARNAE